MGLMVRLYCRHHHDGSKQLCQDCEDLRKYALERLEQCQFGEKKPACSNCTVHCYEPEMRENIRQVMRYSGPKMFLRHPYLSLRFLMEKRKGCKEFGE